MAKIISFISRKGGTGKTTNAIQVATMLHSLGYKLALIETDTNYTLSTLRKMELFKSGAKGGGIFDIIGSEDDKVLADIEAMHPENLDYIIIDSAGKTTDNNIKNLAIQSSAVIVPTSLTQNDLLVTYQTIQDLKPAQDINKNLKIIVLPNRIHSRTSPANIHRQLSDLDTIITENFVPAKNAYAQFSTILPEKQYQSITRELIGILQ